MVLKIAETILSKYNTKHHNVWIERKLTNTNRSGSKLEKAVIKSFSNGPFSASIFAFTFSTVITADLFIIKNSHNWIRTTDLLYQKRPLCQLSHTHWSCIQVLALLTFSSSHRKFTKIWRLFIYALAVK